MTISKMLPLKGKHVRRGPWTYQRAFHPTHSGFLGCHHSASILSKSLCSTNRLYNVMFSWINKHCLVATCLLTPVDDISWCFVIVSTRLPSSSWCGPSSPYCSPVKLLWESLSFLLQHLSESRVAFLRCTQSMFLLCVVFAWTRSLAILSGDLTEMEP